MVPRDLPGAAACRAALAGSLEPHLAVDLPGAEGATVARSGRGRVGGWTMSAWLGGSSSGDVLILGFPSSGKSTYLWALHAHLSSDRIPSHGHDWRVSDPSVELGSFSREFEEKAEKGERLQTTQYSSFELFDVHHRFLWWMPGGMYSFRVNAPDVPGEWITHIAEGGSAPKEGWSEVEFAAFRKSVFSARAFVFLLGGCTAPDAAATLRKEITAFTTLVRQLKKHTGKFRSATFVLAKVDELLKQGRSKGGATFRIAKEQSYLAQWGIAETADASLMKVRLRDQIEAAAGNKTSLQIPLHHALAMDYLRSIAPKAANQLDKLWEERGYRLRVQVMFGSSIGLAGTSKPLECRNPVNLWTPLIHSIDQLSRERGVAVTVGMIAFLAIAMLFAGAAVYFNLLGS